MKIRDFIQENFLIDKAETGEFVPFIFNRVQNKYYDMLVKEYSEEKNFQNLREMILKARKEGFTSLILGIFAAIMCLSKNASRFLEISYKEDATVQHFRRCKNFILSWLSKDPQKWEKIENKVFKNLNDGQEFILRDNLSSFFVGTASVKTGERGGTVQGVLFCVSGDTKIIKWDSKICPIREIKSGDFIIAGDGSKVGVKDVSRRKLDGSEMFLEIRTYGDNTPLKITGDHKVLCRSGMDGAFKPIWKKAKELTENDYMAFPTRELRTGDHPLRLRNITQKAGMGQRFRRGADYYWQGIKSIDKADFEEFVYDIVLDSEPHSYLTVNGVIHNSEDAHYPTTGIISAKEIIEGTRNMVAVGHGIIFRESTGNGYNHYRHDWEMAKRKEVDYKPRFFSWKEFYAPEQFEQIKLGFSDKAMIRQEYPETDVEAFLASEEMVVIDRHDIEACVNNRQPCAAVKRITVCDVAGDGINKSSGDETVIYDMLNTEIKDQEIYRHRDLMDTIGRLVVHQKKNHSNMICVDKVGEGSGVYSRLAEIYAGDAGVTIYGFDGRISAPKPHDETYSNYKTYAWFNARAMFREVQCNIPNDSILKDQLACVTYKNHLREKRILTSKEEIKEKLRASPDRADAYVMGLDALTYAVPLSEGQIAEIEKNGWQGGDFVPVRPNSTKRLVCA